MGMHYVECAALTDLPPSKKLVLMACADSADKDSRLGFPGLDNVMQWCGLGRARTLALLAELVDDGLLARGAAGRKGQRAEFIVFPRGCCAMHAPLPGFAPVGNPVDTESRGSSVADPNGVSGSNKGSNEGSTPGWTPSQLPNSQLLPPSPPQAGGAATACKDHKRPRRGCAACATPAPYVPPWCGGCEAPDRRLVELPDGRVARCPTCHPLEASPPTPGADRDPDPRERQTPRSDR